MEFCQGCGARRVSDNRFCLQCGHAFPEGRISSTQRASPGGMLAWAGPLALIFFFLPWITVSCQMGGPSMTFSGWELAKGIAVAGHNVPGQPSLFLAPIAAVILLGLILYAKGVEGTDASPIAIVQVVAAAIPLLLIVIKYISWIDDVRRNGGGLISMSLHAGFALTALAFLAAGIGGVLDLVDRGRSPAAALQVAPPAPHDVAQAAFCPQCGARNTELGKFCTECGHALA